MLSDIVVCNRDLPAAYELLDLPYGQQKARALAKKEYSAAVIAYNWAVDGTFPRLLQHNVFLSGMCVLWGGGSMQWGWLLVACCT